MILKKKGFELLKSRQTIQSVGQLNGILGYDIDKLLEVFFGSFELGNEGFLNANRFFEGFKMPITFVEYKNVEINLNIRLSHFYSFKDLVAWWSENVMHDEIYQKHNLLPIAYTEINLDHVYTNPKDGCIFYFVNSQKVKLSSNIFEFCLGLIETKIIDEDFKNKSVYRNWNEDFWRIREENVSTS